MENIRIQDNKNILNQVNYKYRYLFDENHLDLYYEWLGEINQIAAVKALKQEQVSLGTIATDYFYDSFNKELNLYDSTWIIENFIERKLEEARDRQTSIEQLDKFADFLLWVGYKIPNEVAFDLVMNNEKINHYLTLFIEDEEELIVDENMKSLFEEYGNIYNIDFTIIEKFRKGFISNVSIYTNKKKTRMSREEQRKLLEQSIEGDKTARNTLITENLGLIPYFSAFFKDTNVIKEVVFQEGVIGFIQSIDSFNLSYNTSLSKHASRWIRNATFRYISKNAFSLSSGIQFKCNALNYRRDKQKLEESNGSNQKYSLKELSSKLQMPMDKVLDFEKAIQEIDSLEDMNVNAIDLDSNVEETVESNFSKMYLNHLLPIILDKKELMVIRQNFGFPGEKRKTLQEIGTSLNVTRARVGQIEKESIKKLTKALPQRGFEY